VQRYDGPGNGIDAANSIAVDALGNVYVTGYSFGSGTGDDYAAVAYNSAGVQNWVQRYNGPANGTDAANSIAIDAWGNVYVTGWSAGSGTGTFDFATLRYRQLPNAPSGLTAIADFSRRINLSWTDNSNNESGFRIERSVNGGANWSLLSSLPSNTSSYLDTGLTPNSIYHYRVNAFNSFGNSPYSNTAFDTAKSSDPIDYINLLISMVNTLKNNGVLNHGQATSLITKLNSAKHKIDHGHIILAKIHMYAFIIHVYVFKNCGILTSQQAQPLIDVAYDVIQILCEMDSPAVNNTPGTPTEFALHNNFPNPFNPVTKIVYDIPKQANVKITVFDILGREVAVLLNEKLNPGHYEAVFDGTNYSSGVYYYRMVTDYYESTKKMILIK
jgi:hypothetical protein